MGDAPAIDGVLETPVYVDDLDRAERFYAGVLGLAMMTGGDRLRAVRVAEGETLLLCLRGATGETLRLEGGTIPGHESHGPGHFAFRIPENALDAWRARLAAHGVAVTAEMCWPKGGVSLYFDDPDGNVVELATPGLWPNYLRRVEGR
jgi:catechol 2,3-dioxygenase-like lactoylglutathione lyase family enzyme